jgi:hypothetical protein
LRNPLKPPLQKHDLHGHKHMYEGATCALQCRRRRISMPMGSP